MQFLISTSLSSAMDAENISVLISPEKSKHVPNPIPIILGTIIVKLASTIYSFVKVVVNIRQEEYDFHLRIIFVKNVEPCTIVRSN